MKFEKDGVEYHINMERIKERKETNGKIILMADNGEEFYFKKGVDNQNSM